MKLTPEQFNAKLEALTPEQRAQFEEIAQPVATCLAWAIAKSNTDIDNDVIELVKDALDQVDPNNPPTDEQAVEALLTLGHKAAEATKTKVDDGIMNFLEGFAKGNVFKQLWAAIQTSIADRREKRRAAKEAAAKEDKQE